MLHVSPPTSASSRSTTSTPPPVVVGSRNWITPCAEQEDVFFPQPAWILDAIHERILPLKDHVVTTNATNGEAIRRNRLGV